MSVVIPVLNGATTLTRQLDAIASSVVVAQWEVVVADNGSTDNTVNTALRHPLAARGRLRVVDASRKRGINVARNVGVGSSRGRLIVICDSDDEVEPDWLVEHYKVLAGVEVGVSAGPLLTERLNDERARSWSEGLDAPARFGPYLSGFGANFGFTRAAWELVGGFDETFIGGFDEIDFMARVQGAGGCFIWTDMARVNYRLPSTHRRLIRRSYQFGKMSVQLALKHPEVEMGSPQSQLRDLKTNSVVLLKRLLTCRGSGRRLSQTAYSIGVIRAANLRWDSLGTSGVRLGARRNSGAGPFVRLVARARFRRAWPLISPIDGWMSREECLELFVIASRSLGRTSIVEIGSYKGRSTVALALANRRRIVFAVDPHTGGRLQLERGEFAGSYAEFVSNLAKIGLQNVSPIVKLSLEAAASYSGPSVGLLFVDGWHSTEAVVQDYRAWRWHLADGAIVVFDDREMPEVAEALAILSAELPGGPRYVGKLAIYGG